MVKTVAIISAMDAECGIGKNGIIPWKHADDMKFFRNTTQGSVCIMGRTTYEEIKSYKKHCTDPLLQNRISIVVSTKIYGSPSLGLYRLLSKSGYPYIAYAIGNATYAVKSVEEAYDFAGEFSIYPNIFFIGGKKIYKSSLPYINKVYLNRIYGTYNCDTFFPVEEILTSFILNRKKVLAEDLIAYEYVKGCSNK